MLGPYLSQIVILHVCNRETILGNMNVVVWGQVKSENSSLPVVVRVSKTRMLKLPIILPNTAGNRDDTPHRCGLGSIPVRCYDVG